MKRFSISLPVLVGVGAFGIAVGFGLGRVGKGTTGDGVVVSDAREPGATAALEPPTVTAMSVGMKAAQGEVRPFQPGRPFPKGGAEAWLRGLRTGEDDIMDIAGMMASMRQLSTLDAESAREVADAIASIYSRLEADEEGDETVEVWEDSEDMLMFGLITSLGIVAEEDPEAAIALLGAMEDADEEYVALILVEIARNAPDRLESLLAGLDEEALPDALYGAVHGLFDSDPDAVMGLLGKYPGEDFQDVRRDSVRRMTETDPRRGAEMAAGFVRDGDGTDPLGSAVSDWLDADEAGARAWVENYQGPGREAALASVISLDARDDPRGAMREFAAMRARGAADEHLAEVATAITRGLATDDVSAARTWVDALPEGSSRKDAVRQLANIWVNKDAPAASEWIATLPKGDARDDAAGTIARSIVESDPVAAFEWARSIGNASARENRMDEVMGEWRKKDPVAAYAAAAAAAMERALQETE